jgi:hypothetical protein
MVFRGGGLFDDDDDFLFDYLLWSQMQITIIMIMIFVALNIETSCGICI